MFVGTPPSLTENAVSGVATFPSLAIDTAGAYQIAATNTSLGSVTSNTVTVTANPQQAILAWITQPPGQVVHGVGFGAVVDVEDQYGNLETSYTGSVVMALDVNPGSATLGGNSTVPAVGGVATFSGLTISALGNGYTLQATSGGVTSPDSNPIDVTAIPPTGMSVTTQPPTSVQVVQAFGLTVTIDDQAGVADPDFNGSVTVAIAGPPSGNTLSGTKTVTASGGVATFSGLTLSSVGTVTLQVSSSGLTSVTTGSINVTASTASQLIFVAEPASSQTAGAPFGFKVEAEDAFGNLATTFDGTLVAALSPNSGNATLAGAVTAVASGGVAVFSGVSVNQVGSGYTIQVSGVNGPPATSTPFNVSIGAATELVIPTQPPSSVTAGDPFSLTVAVADPYGNIETSFSGPITIGLLGDPKNGALNGTLTATATNGVATFSGLSLFTAASGYTIQAKSGNLTAVTSSPMSVTPAGAAKLAVSIPPPSTLVAGADFGLSIVAEDAYNNITTGFTGTVTLALQTPSGSVSLSGGPLSLAASGGVASFPPSLAIDTAGSGDTIQATSPGLTAVNTAVINVSPAPATHLVVLTEPPSALAIGTGFGFVVAAEDQFGDVDPNFSAW